MNTIESGVMHEMIGLAYMLTTDMVLNLCGEDSPCWKDHCCVGWTCICLYQDVC
jgi:hypothetical protein